MSAISVGQFFARQRASNAIRQEPDALPITIPRRTADDAAFSTSDRERRRAVAVVEPRRAAPRIVLDARSLIGPRAGVGRYTGEVAQRLAQVLPEVDLGFHKVRVSREPPVVVFASWKAQVRRLPPARAAARLLIAAASRWTVRCDLYWAPNHALPAGVRAPRTVVTVHDLSWRLHPQWHPKDRIALFSRRVPRSLARADAIITVSRSIQDELVEVLHVPAERIRVIPNGIDAASFRPRSVSEAAPVLARLGLGTRPFLLTVGTIEPRKNLQTLLAAWARLGDRGRRDHLLAVAGGEGWQDGALRAALASAGQTVKVLGRVDDESLAALYSAATALAYPSVYEGFGLPPLEALASGTLPIVADIPVMREVVGDLGVLFGRPLDVEALASALDTALDRGYPDDAIRARRRAAAGAFSWDRSARAHADLFSGLLR